MNKTNKLIHQASAFCLRNIIAATLCLLSPLLAIAADDTWNGRGTNNYWNITTNWVDLNVPGVTGPGGTSSDVATFAASTNTRTAVDFTSTINGRSLTIGRIVVNASLTNTDFRIISSQATSGGNFRIDGVSGVGIDMSSAAQQFSFGATGSGNDFRVYVQNDQSWDVTSATAGANLNLRYSSPTDGISLYLQNMDSSAARALTLNVGSGRSVFLDGPVVGAGSLIKTNAGTLRLSGINTYAGVTTISGGTLQVNDAGALGATSGDTVVTNGGSLALAGGITVSGEALTLSGDGTGGNNGALRSISTSTAATWAGAITLSGDARVRGENGEMVISGPITDNGSNYMLTLHAAGTGGIVRLNSAGNTLGVLRLYGFNLSNGRTFFGAANVAPQARLRPGGGRHDLNGFDQSFNGIDDGTDVATGVVTNSGSSATLTITGTNVLAMSVAIAGPINIVKSGSGLQALNGANTHSGTTTVTAGTLRINGNSSGATNDWAVSGGSLEGTGTIGGPMTIGAGGTLSPGVGGIGTLTCNNSVTLNAGSALAMDINKTGVTLTGDQIAGATGISGSSALNVTASGDALAGGDTFTLLNVTPTATFTPSLPALGAGLNWFTSDNYATLTVNGAPTGSDIELGVGLGETNTVVIIGGKQAPTDPDVADIPNLVVSGVGGSPTKGTASFTSTSVTYVSSGASSGADSFTYTVSDGRGGAVTQTVNVTVGAGGNGANITSLSGTVPNITVYFAGLPNSTYSIERATSSSGPWSQIAASVSTGTNGQGSYLDTSAPSPSGYYRTRYVSTP